MALISEETVALVRGVAAEAERLETPCGDGHMVWHVWGSGPPLMLLHGGYGSWTHWIRNVLPLSRAFTVAAPDLPGLGESATPPEPHTADGLARIIVEGIDIAFPRPADLRIAGFSFGGVLGGRVAVQFGERRTHRAVGVKSRRFSRADTLARALPLVKARLDGIWGERDATAYPHLDDRARALRDIQPGARFEVIAGAGHWVQYEAADRFNPILAEIAGS